MNIQVLAINATSEIGTFNVVVLFGEKHHQFNIKVDLFTVATQVIQVTNGDEYFSKVFRFNQIVASNTCKLVSKVHNNQAVALPADVGEFYPSEIELALL